jgi:hypothetical protein
MASQKGNYYLQRKNLRLYRETSNTGMPTFKTVDVVVTSKNASQYDNSDSLHHSSRHSLISYFALHHAHACTPSW